MERPPPRRCAALGDAALEVQDAQVCLADRRNQLGCKERPRRDREPLGDATAEHRVAGERNLHVPKPYRPTSRTNPASATVRTRAAAPSRLQNRTTSSSPPRPIGWTRRPSAARCATSGGGTCGNAAETRIASYGAGSGTPSPPSPTPSSTVGIGRATRR